MDKEIFRKFLVNDGRISAQAVERLSAFRELVLRANEVQNLTRLTTAQDFYEGHILDCIELVESGFLRGSNLDLGAGAGVPGIPSAMLSGENWVLAESESHKSDYLKQAVQALHFSDQVKVYHGRAEGYLSLNSVDTVVARAVGPVGRIFSWVRQCSTWNNLILLKGPGWESEWTIFKKSSAGKKLKHVASHAYNIGAERKKRVIVLLSRE